MSLKMITDSYLSEEPAADLKDMKPPKCDFSYSDIQF